MAMTESEARSKIKWRISTAGHMVGFGEDGKAFEDLEIALQVMKEIREYRDLGTVEELQELKEKNVIPIATINFNKEDMQEIVDEKIKEFELDIKEIRNKAIDDFAERIKQGDVIEYMGSYVSYEAIASFIDEIAEKMKGGATDERTGSN